MKRARDQPNKGTSRGNTSLIAVTRHDSHASLRFRRNSSTHTLGHRSPLFPTSPPTAARHYTLTHLTRRRAAAAVTRLTVVAAARIQITFRTALALRGVGTVPGILVPSKGTSVGKGLIKVVIHT